jgi:hypothetical protein
MWQYCMISESPPLASSFLQHPIRFLPCCSPITNGLFYGGPYHLISLLEKDQYERIQRLRLIVYHHNLHMWYTVVCICGMSGIGVLLEILSRTKYMISSFQLFFHFHLVIWPKFFKEIKQKFSFQISKMKNSKFKKRKKFNFSFQIFVTYFKMFKFQSKFQNHFFSFFSIFYGHFFSKFENKNFNSNFKNDFFPKFFISNFPYGLNNFFLSPRLPNLLKYCKNYLFILTKNSPILHTTTW